MEWKVSPAPVPYEDAIAFMEARVRAIREDKADEFVWLLEHPALYTAGSSANEADLLDTLGFPVYNTGRGGQYTYHGPGQRVAYVMLDLKRRGGDVRRFVKQLEAWVIATLAGFGVTGFTREGRVGVWVDSTKAARIRGGVLYDDLAGVNSRSEEGEAFPLLKESKIAAIGVRIRQWVSYHGISLNVHPDLSHYRGIVPCGISEYGITSLAALGINAGMEQVDTELMHRFREIFPARAFSL